MNIIDLLPQGQFAPLGEINIYGLINTFVQLILIFSSILFVFNILIGGIKFILSRGEKDKKSQASRQIFNAFIGITIIFGTWAVMGFLSQFFGIDLLYFKIPSI